MGSLQFFRKLISKFSKVTAPLTKLKKKVVGSENWNLDDDSAFAKLNDSLIQSPIFVASDKTKVFRGHVDAFLLAAGGTLMQIDDDGRDRVIAFFSKKL